MISGREKKTFGSKVRQFREPFRLKRKPSLTRSALGGILSPSGVFRRRRPLHLCEQTGGTGYACADLRRRSARESVSPCRAACRKLSAWNFMKLLRWRNLNPVPTVCGNPFRQNAVLSGTAGKAICVVPGLSFDSQGYPPRLRQRLLRPLPCRIQRLHRRPLLFRLCSPELFRAAFTTAPLTFSLRRNISAEWPAD